MHLVMCLALNKRPLTKERQKEEESKKHTTIRGCFEKNIMKSVDSCKFKIVYKHCLCLLKNFFRVLFITYDVDDKLMLCKPTLHGYNKLARDKAHDILWPCTRA